VPALNLGLFFVFFVYGVAFLGMGIAMLLEAGRSPALAEARLLRPLAVFGILHGLHEWLEFFLLQASWLGVQIPPQISWYRVGLLLLSFGSLLIYSIQAFHQSRPQGAAIYLALLGGYVLFIAGNAIASYPGIVTTDIPIPGFADAMIRYLMAVPGALLAATGLHFQSRHVRHEGRLSLAANLNLAALGFMAYGLTQLLVHPLPMFPAQMFNRATFQEFTGIPTEAVRSALAVIITLGLVRATQDVEEERQNEVLAAQQARLETLEQQEAMRRELLRYTVRAQEEERGRIARELHDETAQVLSAFSLNLATLHNSLPKRADVTQLVENLQNLSRQMSQGLYRLVHDLRPAHLDDLGLVPALKYFIEQDCCPQGLDASLEIKGPTRRLDPFIETALFRVAQEALTNVTRHAETEEAYVQFSFEPDQVTLRVIDNGKGFDPDELFIPPRGWGLAGMKERVEAVGGQFRLHSAPGQGTQVEAVIPATELVHLEKEGSCEND